MCCPTPTGPAPPVFFWLFQFLYSFHQPMKLHCSCERWKFTVENRTFFFEGYGTMQFICLNDLVHFPEPAGMLSCSCLSHTSTRMFVFHEAIIRLVYLNTNTTPEKLQVLVTGARQNISKYCVCCEINVVFAQNSWLCSLRTGNSDG